MKLSIMKIRDFVEEELQMFRDKCNFTDEELQIFNLRAKDVPYTAIAYRLGMSESKVYAIAKRVKKKMLKVI